MSGNMTPDEAEHDSRAAMRALGFYYSIRGDGLAGRSRLDDENRERRNMTPEQAEHDFQKELDHGNRRVNLMENAGVEDWREAFRDHMSINDAKLMSSAYRNDDSYLALCVAADVLFRWAGEMASEEEL